MYKIFYLHLSDEFMKKEIAEYQIGKRHLANMMGEDPNCFTQADIDVCDCKRLVGDS